MILVESVVQVRPQMKSVRRGSEQGSVVKFHEARQDQGWMEEGLMEALKALSAAMSEGEVRALTRIVLWKRMRERETKVRERKVRVCIFVGVGFSVAVCDEEMLKMGWFVVNF